MASSTGNLNRMAASGSSPAASDVRGQRWDWTKTAAVNLAFQLGGIILGLVIWQILSARNGSAFLPSPGDTIADIRANFFQSEYLIAHGIPDNSGYLPQLLYTTRNVFVGVCLGSILGASLGVASARSWLLSEIASAVMLVFGSAPIFVAAPFFLIWFGILPSAQILIVTFYTTLLMFLFGRRAADNVAASYIESAMTLGAKPATLIRRLYLPAAMPEMIGGFRIALAGAWGLEAIAELLGAEQGAGFIIKWFASAYLVQGMLSLVLLIGLIGVFFDRLLVLGGMWLTRWAESGRRLAL
jgi:ABC-type nitrate/sulfonate/bicarbonate transport system permease component